jgi:hypothetical protein
MKNAFASIVFAVSVATSVPIGAHHGDAGRYDEGQFTITGTIVEIKYTNPHSLVVFDATDPAGTVTRWQAEMGNGNQLKQAGWTKDNPKVGDKITLIGRKVKSGAPYMNMTEKAQIVMADTGKEIYRTANFGKPDEPKQ